MDNNLKIEAFNIIGISVRTSNQNGQGMKDIPALWNEFMSKQIASKIPNKINDAIYCIYTDYEKDHTKPYTTIIGCKVANLDSVPEGMVAKSIDAGNYTKFVAEGSLLQGSVISQWIKIWNTKLNRKYTADFEIYDEKAQNPEDAVVDIFVAIE